jgi:hypothetical protein
MIEIKKTRGTKAICVMMVTYIFFEDVDADNIDDAHDDELVTSYNKENHIIAVCFQAWMSL